MPFHNAAFEATHPPRPLGDAIKRGLLAKCPACGKGSLFDGYLKVKDVCPSCGEELHHHRADDAPPYFTILIVGHVIVGMVLAVEVEFKPPLWVHFMLWVPLTIIVALAVLRPIKGAVVGLQWALYMHGFDPEAEPDMPEPEPRPAEAVVRSLP